jgi:hypothetical protein
MVLRNESLATRGSFHLTSRPLEVTRSEAGGPAGEFKSLTLTWQERTRFLEFTDLEGKIEMKIIFIFG